MKNLDKPTGKNENLYLSVGYALKPQTPHVINYTSSIIFRNKNLNEIL